MLKDKQSIRCLSGNALRIIGRIAFPIFAFMIAQGAKYTRSRVRYFMTIFLMGIAYTLVFFVYSKILYFCILLTFSMSLLMIFTLQNFKRTFFSTDSDIKTIIIYGSAFVATVVAVYVFNICFRIDYGFIGCITPLLVSMFFSEGENVPAIFKKFDCLIVHICCLSVGLVLLYIVYGGIRIYALLAVPLLLLYSGKRGNARMKYFFYIFYPSHLLLLEGIYALISVMKK